MKRHLLSTVFFWGIFLFHASAQLGGLHTYEFLNLSPSARVTALGGSLITVRDDDANLAFQNPALLNQEMHQYLGFNHNFHFSGIQHGYAGYAHHAQKWNTTFHAGIQYISYGQFDETNELGETLGSFKAAEYALTLGVGRTVYDRLSLGANIKMISSQLAGYNSFGIASDLAAVYLDTASNLTATILFRNIGTQLSTYREANNEPLPFDIQIGLSKKLKYLPFRFSIIYHNLHRWNLLYDNPVSGEDGTIFFGDSPSEQSRSAEFFDNLFRHFIFNGELLIGQKENFRLRIGYNHFRRKELSVENYGSMAGFSFGGGIKINRFRLDYGHSVYHIAGGLNHLSISTHFREFR